MPSYVFSSCPGPGTPPSLIFPYRRANREDFEKMTSSPKRPTEFFSYSFMHTLTDINENNAIDFLCCSRRDRSSRSRFGRSGPIARSHVYLVLRPMKIIHDPVDDLGQRSLWAKTREPFEFLE